MLKWHTNKPNTTDICTIVESETEWMMEIECSAGEKDLSIVLSYSIVDNADGYIKGLKVNGEKWEAPIGTIDPDVNMFDFFGDCIDNFLANDTTEEERGLLIGNTYKMLEEFCEERKIYFQ